jgi:hypothetical protein
MSYITQGTVKVVLGTTKLKVLSTNDYRITHRKVAYTAFIKKADEGPEAKSFEAKSFEAKCFKEDTEFDFDAHFTDHLVESALKDVCLEVTIDDTDPKVIAIQIPA